MSDCRIITGDALATLRTLDASSVQCCVTSPPYWGLRDYGVPGQLGLEATPEEYVSRLIDVTREVRRVLADDGTLWLVLGDCYARSGSAPPRRDHSRGVSLGTYGRQAYSAASQGPRRNVTEGTKPKDLVGIPWRVAFALQADGWYLRSDIIWAKPNPMPESVTDRPTKAHEYLFLLATSKRYYYDAEATSEPATYAGTTGCFSGRGIATARASGRMPSGNEASGHGRVSVGETRNRRTVWTLATQPYPGAHFATFPEALVEPCILAGSREGDTVLDPFCGSGTTGVVALKQRRRFLGIELNPEYVVMAERRIGEVTRQTRFSWVGAVVFGVVLGLLA